MNKDIVRVEELKKNELDRVIALFCLVWGDKYSIVEAKTKWAFENPFSKVLVMKNESGSVIAVRGGIEWPLQYEGENIKAIQFHGTCVHPDYRRKGFFSLINKSFVSLAKENGFELIFNVSVKASRLGYEKLGWKYTKGFQRLTKVHLFNSIKKKKEHVFEDEQCENIIEIPESVLKERNRYFKNLVSTNYTKDFFKWRLSNGKENYFLFSHKEAYIIYKIKKIANKKHLIIGDVFLMSHNYKDFKRAFNLLFKKVVPDLSYTYIHKGHPYYKFYLQSLFIPNFMNLNLNFGVKELKKENTYTNLSWGCSFLDIDTF